MNKAWKIFAIVCIVAIIAGAALWYQLRYVSAQPAWISSTPLNRYFYGSVGAAKTRGIPYWVWLAMPRLFPEHMPGTGGYASLGMAWQEGIEMPVGFAKQNVGYTRVTGNCALCHAMTKPKPGQPDQAPDILPAVEGSTTGIDPLIKFMRDCAADPRFNADEFFSEIDSDTSMSLWDKTLYRYWLIPQTRKALLNDPKQILFSPAILAHAKNPQSIEPFSDPKLMPLRDFVHQPNPMSVQ